MLRKKISSSSCCRDTAKVHSATAAAAQAEKAKSSATKTLSEDSVNE